MFPIAEYLGAAQQRFPELAPLLDLFVIGGPVVWVLTVFSVVALAIMLLKLWQMLRTGGGGADSRRAVELLREGKAAEAQASLQNQRNPRNLVMAQTIRLLRQDTLSTDEIQAESVRYARSVLAPFESGLRPLEVIAMLAPLLGLLGTVLGMIEAFRAMQAAGDQVNPALLSGGIWQALVTTAVGLAVAIPVSLVHSWLERRHELRALNVANDVQQALTVYAESRESELREPQPVKAERRAA